MPTHSPWFTIGGRTLGVAGAVALVIAAAVALAPAASAGIGTYSGDITSGEVNLNTGSSNPTVITALPGHLDATADDTAHTVSATATFQPTYTPSFEFFSNQLYAKAVITQVGSATGTYDAGAVTLPMTAHLDITILNQAGATQNPATDPPITGPGCGVDVVFEFTGTLNEASGVLDVSDPQFTIADFPAACGAAQGAINDRLAGPNNSIHLVFGGTYTTTTTSTTTTTAPTTSTTSTTSSTTTSTSVPATTVPATTSTSTTAPVTTISSTSPASTTTALVDPTSVPSSVPSGLSTTTPATSVTSTTRPTATTTTEGGGETTTVPAPITEPPAHDIPTVEVDAGGSIEVTGDGCAAGAEVVVTLDEDGRRIGGGTADADGAFALTLQIPSDLVVGDHPATATCPALDARARTTSVHLGGYQVNGQVATQHLRIRVVSARTSPLGVPAAEAGGSALARTGSDNGPLVAVGVLSVTVGAAFVYGSRRLRSAR